MSTFQFKFKANRSAAEVQTGAVNADTLTQALALVREEHGANILILGYNSFPNF